MNYLLNEVNPALALAWVTVGVVGLLWLSRHLQKHLSILDAFMAITIGALVGVPILLVAIAWWILSKPVADWLTKPRWQVRQR